MPRRSRTAFATVAVAILVGLALPVAQLRLIEVIKACCCPDPERCHCPDHDDDTSPQPSMRACHNTQQAFTTPPMPAFEPPAVAAVAAPLRIAMVSTELIDAPHAPPPPRRPAAPS